jgi:hypothetical protein
MRVWRERGSVSCVFREWERLLGGWCCSRVGICVCVRSVVRDLSSAQYADKLCLGPYLSSSEEPLKYMLLNPVYSTSYTASMNI